MEDDLIQSLAQEFLSQGKPQQSDTLLDEQRNVLRRQAATTQREIAGQAALRNEPGFVESIRPVPGTLTEEFQAGLRSGAEGLRSDALFFKGLFNTIVGDESQAAADIRNARALSESASAELKDAESFGDFLDEPTVGGFLSQVTRGVGQILPSAALSIGSAGAGAVTAVAGRGVISLAEKALVKRIVQDSVNRTARNTASPLERQIAQSAYDIMRSYGRTAKTGAIAGAFGAEFVPLSGSNLSEALDSGYQLDEATAARAALVGVPQAAIGTGGEVALLKLIGEQALKRSAVEGGLFANFGKKVLGGGLRGGAIEGATETAQEGIAVANRSNLDPLFTAEEARLRLAESAFVGFFGGAAPGAAGGAVGGTLDVARATPEVFNKAREMLKSANEQRVNAEVDKQQFGDVYTGNTTPEPSKDLAAQMNAMMDITSGKQAVWVASDTVNVPEFGFKDYKAKPNKISNLVIERGGAEQVIYSALVPGRGTIFSPHRDVVEEVIASAASDESLQIALGYSAVKKNTKATDSVIQVLDRNGGVVSEEAVAEGNEQAALDAARKLMPIGGTIQTLTVEQAMERRKQRYEAEQPKVVMRDMSVEDDGEDVFSKFSRETGLDEDNPDDFNNDGAAADNATDSRIDGYEDGGLQETEGRRVDVPFRGTGIRARDDNGNFVTYANTDAVREEYAATFGMRADPAMTEALLKAAVDEQKRYPESRVSIERMEGADSFKIVRDDPPGADYLPVTVDGKKTFAESAGALHTPITLRAGRTKLELSVAEVLEIAPDALPSSYGVAKQLETMLQAASKFIGRSSFSTKRGGDLIMLLTEAFGDKANSGRYSANDVVLFLDQHSTLKTRRALRPDLAELGKAVRAKATILTFPDNQTSGWREATEFLQQNGYVETPSSSSGGVNTAHSVWTPPADVNTRTKWLSVAEFLRYEIARASRVLRNPENTARLAKNFSQVNQQLERNPVTVVAPDGKSTTVALWHLVNAGRGIASSRRETPGLTKTYDAEGNVVTDQVAAARNGLNTILAELALNGYQVLVKDGDRQISLTKRTVNEAYSSEGSVADRAAGDPRSSPENNPVVRGLYVWQQPVAVDKERNFITFDQLMAPSNLLQSEKEIAVWEGGKPPGKANTWPKPDRVISGTPEVLVRAKEALKQRQEAKNADGSRVDPVFFLERKSTESISKDDGLVGGEVSADTSNVERTRYNEATGEQTGNMAVDEDGMPAKRLLDETGNNRTPSSADAAIGASPSFTAATEAMAQREPLVDLSRGAESASTSVVGSFIHDLIKMFWTGRDVGRSPAVYTYESLKSMTREQVEALFPQNSASVLEALSKMEGDPSLIGRQIYAVFDRDGTASSMRDEHLKSAKFWASEEKRYQALYDGVVHAYNSPELVIKFDIKNPTGNARLKRGDSKYTQAGINRKMKSAWEKSPFGMQDQRSQTTYLLKHYSELAKNAANAKQYHLRLYKEATKTSAVAPTITARPRAVIIYRPSGNPLQDALVVSHEIGHTLYLMLRDGALENKALRDRLLAAYRKSSSYEDLKARYGEDIGFEEWFSDQVSLWAAKRYKERSPANMVERFFKQFVANLRKLWSTMNKSLQERLKGGVDQDFETFINEIVELRKKNDTGYPTFVQQAFATEIRDMATASPGAQRLSQRVQAALAGAQGAKHHSVFRPLMKIVRSADSVLRMYGGNEIADMFYVRSNDPEADGKLGFIPQSSQTFDRFLNKFRKEIGEIDSADVIAAMNEAATDTPTDQLPNPKAKAIRKFLEDMHSDYITPSKTKIGFIKNYFPRALDLANIYAEPDKFIKLVIDADTRAGKPRSRAFVESTVNGLFELQKKILNNEKIEGDLLDPASKVVDALELTVNLTREELAQAGFLEAPADAFQSYVKAIVKRVEFDRHTKGDANYYTSPTYQGDSKLEMLMSKLTPEDRAQVRQVLNTYMGYREPLTPFWRKLNSWGQFLQFITILPFATIASLTDLAGPMIASREFGGITMGIKEIIASIKNREESKQFARDVGIVVPETVANAWVTESEADFMDPTVRKYSDYYFRRIGLSWFTRFTREFAAGMAVQFLAKHARNEFNNPYSDRYLQEHGVTRKEVLDWLAGGRKLSTPEGVKMRQAVQRFVASSVLRPNSAERPMWGSDPHWALVWQLKGYFYSYGKVMLGGIAREYAARLKSTSVGTPNSRMASVGYLLALTFASTLPFAMLGLELREFAKYGLAAVLPFVDADARYFRTDRMDYPSYAYEIIVNRSGIHGPMGIPMAASAATDYGPSFGAALLGPTAEMIDTALDNGFRVDRTLKDRLLPLYNQL